MCRSDGCRKTVLLAAFLLMTVLSGWAQRRPFPGPRRPLPEEKPVPTLQTTLTRRMLQASYEQLKKDVDRLMELATELQKEGTKANEDVLSIEVVKKAEEVEKLAKKIQGRMKNL